MQLYHSISVCCLLYRRSRKAVKSKKSQVKRRMKKRKMKKRRKKRRRNGNRNTRLLQAYSKMLLPRDKKLLAMAPTRGKIKSALLATKPRRLGSKAQTKSKVCQAMFLAQTPL